MVEDMFDYEYDDGTNYQYIPKTWPTPSNITEAQARQTCEESLAQSAALDKCKGLVNVTTIIQACMFDIKVRKSSILHYKVMT